MSEAFYIVSTVVFICLISAAVSHLRMIAHCMAFLMTVIANERNIDLSEDKGAKS